MNYEELVSEFLATYGGDARGVRVFEAPGRVNLIGEHTDYNGGYVFPTALTFSNVAVVRPRSDNVIRLTATSVDERVEAPLDQLERYRGLNWGHYQLGVAHVLQQSGYALVGADMLYHGTVPYGGGLSSSASIEVVTAIALSRLAGHEIDGVEMALVSQRAENEFVGMQCGIMDQFASAMGKAGHAILLDCASLEYEYAPLNLGAHKLVIINTNKPRSLITSKYNERRAECESALAALRTVMPELNALCHCSREQLEEYRALMPNETVYRRARHAVCENARTIKAAALLKEGDLKGFGALMNESHASLRDDYEVTGPELDAIYDAALDFQGVLGVRMTGAGFGGCAVAIAHEDAIEALSAHVTETYSKAIGYAPSVYVCSTGDGVREIDWDNGKE